jgi:UDP-N-acetylglucosamine acyltransferase
VISDKAVIDPKAKIAPNVTIGHFSVIGPDVEIDEGTWVGPHVVIQGPTKIGKNNHFFQFSSIGEAPQDKKYKGEATQLIIGDNNTFRECVTVSRGTTQGGGKTEIGHNNLFMAYVHIAHDCIVGSHTVFSNNASLAGHVIVNDYANLGGLVGVHQFCTIGSYSFCGGGSIVVKDVAPYVMVSGYPAVTHGLNVEGLKRRGFEPDVISSLKRAYKILFRQGLTIEQSVEKILESEESSKWIELLTNFVKNSERGIIR